MIAEPSHPLVERARRLAPSLVAHRAAHDQARQLTPEAVASLREQGLLAALVPTELGGHQLAAPVYVELLEEVARGDSATAWCLMTASTSTLLATYLPRATAERLWSGTAPFLAGIFAPGGALVASATGELRLSGRWSYASGCRHAEVMALGAMHEGRHVVCFVPASAARILDNWDTLGLAGTGSHDLELSEVRVPQDHLASLFARTPWTSAALYRVPVFGLLAAGISACGLGIARAALEHAAARLGATAGKLVELPPPTAIVAAGLTFAGHRDELGLARPAPGELPQMFAKEASCFCPRAGVVAMPSYRALCQAADAVEPGLGAALRARYPTLPVLLDYEVEIAIAVLEPASARELAAGKLPRLGYCLVNDLTARALQLLGEGQPSQAEYWRAAKSFPDFLPAVGTAWVPTSPADALPKVNLRTLVNGQVRQEALSTELLFRPSQLLTAAAATLGRDLGPGDLVLTGTPAGVALRAPLAQRVAAAKGLHHTRGDVALRDVQLVAAARRVAVDPAGVGRHRREAADAQGAAHAGEGHVQHAGRGR